MVLDEKTRGLIAVGASFTAHCEPCLAAHAKKAAAAGAAQDEIREALEIARQVRGGAASAMDRFAARSRLDLSPVTPGCGCEAGPQSASKGCT